MRYDVAYLAFFHRTVAELYAVDFTLVTVAVDGFFLDLDAADTGSARTSSSTITSDRAMQIRCFNFLLFIFPSSLYAYCTTCGKIFNPVSSNFSKNFSSDARGLVRQDASAGRAGTDAAGEQHMPLQFTFFTS